MSVCNPISIQFIDAYARQLDILAVWTIPVLGFTLGTLTVANSGLFILQTLPRQNRPSKVASNALRFSSILLFASLVVYYFANNALTQAIPEMCLVKASASACPATYTRALNKIEFYRKSLLLMRIQYAFFAIALAAIILSFFLVSRLRLNGNNSEKSPRAEEHTGEGDGT